MRTKIYWLSRHALSPGQNKALADLHGEVEVTQVPVNFDGDEGLARFVAEHRDGFVYAVATAVQYMTAMTRGTPFGLFVNHPAKRADSTFGLAAVYHVSGNSITRMWSNPDPASDTGEKLTPVRR